MFTTVWTDSSLCSIQSDGDVAELAGNIMATAASLQPIALQTAHQSQVSAMTPLRVRLPLYNKTEERDLGDVSHFVSRGACGSTFTIC